jgi:Sulfatase
MTRKIYNKCVVSGILTIFLSSMWLCFADRLISFLSGDVGEASLSWSHVVTLAGGQGIASVIVALLVLFVTVAGARASDLTGKRTTRPLIRATICGLFGAAVFFWAGLEFASGDWISEQSYAWMIPPVLALVGAFGMAAIVLFFLYVFENYRENLVGQFLVSGVLAGLSLGCAAANVEILFNLYSRFHVILYALSALFTFFLFLFLSDTLRKIFRPRALLGAVLSAFLLNLLMISSWVTMDRSTRSELIIKAATFTDTIRYLSHVRTPSWTKKSLLYQALDVVQPGGGPVDETVSLPRGLKTIPDDWNVILLVSDQTRADSYEPVRQGRQKSARSKDTPFMNKWFQRTTRFKYVYSQAAATKRSMPHMFRSIESYENPKRNGVALANYMKNLGRKPVAVVPSLFQAPNDDYFTALLDGFEEIDFFRNDQQHETADKALGMIEAVKDEPFFAWIHFYSLHAPGFAGNRQLSPKDGSSTKRYRKSLQWIDKQFAKVFTGIEDMGLMKNTVIVFAADHGTNLGDNRSDSHGSTVWEETVRVPLAFYIPGVKGRVIKRAVVGNIDIVPTLADLMGAPEQNLHRGKSLLPLIINPKNKWDRDYYFRARQGGVAGLVHGRQKIIHDVDGDALYRFDLKADPKENKNLFDLKNPVDQDMLLRLMQHTPLRFEKFLEHLGTQQLLSAKVADIEPGIDSRDLSFLLTLAVKDPSGKSCGEIKKVYEKYDHRGLRLAIIKHMFAEEPKYWTTKVEAEIERVMSTDGELELIRQLAAQGQPHFSPATVSGRMGWWIAQGNVDTWEPWLELIDQWKNTAAASFAPLQTEMLTRIQALEAPHEPIASSLVKPQVIRQVLHSIVMLEFTKSKRDKELKSGLVRIAQTFLKHHSAQVQTEAAKVLGSMGNAETSAVLRAKLKEKGLAMPFRQAALHGIYRLEGEKSLDLLVELGRDQKLSLDVIIILKKGLYKKGLPFLKEMAKTHNRQIIREKAGKTAKLIKRSKKNS